ncbi:MAG: sigma-70 family RNA polymerase sigma factor [Akkermansiaceae bacterium]|jgi:RNA polymerase sigma-70 factor (ECF subfamily)|tara:strand:+ start:846 stop:1649 length:804 start_codon:yes stop_codon:yes gene_type:complete
MNIFNHIASNSLKGPLPPDSSPDGGPVSDIDGTSGNTSQGDKVDGPEALENKDHTADPVDKNKENEQNEQNERASSASEDAEWVKKAQQGDTRAFDRLVTKHRGKIYAMIINMVKNDADAWDLSQEAFIKAWKALPKFEARSRFSTWLFRISHNVVYDWLRKRRIESDGELNDEVFDANRIDPGAIATPHHDKRPDEALEQSELQQQIQDAIGKLSEEHREVILLREVQGLDYKEISEITENSLGTVMSRLHYARKKLQTYLAPQRG